MKKAILLLLLFLPLAFAYDWSFDSDYVDIEFSIVSDLIIAKQPGFSVDYVKSKLLFFPRDSFQQRVLELDTDPSSSQTDDSLVFSWDSPFENLLSSAVVGVVRVSNVQQKVKNKVKFPFNSDSEFLNPSENIDFDSSLIRRQASLLASGRDDLFVIVSDIAQWVSANIEYDLSCGTRVEKASWVFVNRRGTCDEFSSLFIAMCRSLGIPAKYVSGVAYSNLPELIGFGPHAWAEVYFPDVGWVPFDPTFGQHGFVDVSHVKMMESLDPDEPSSRFEWKASGIDVEPDKLEITAKLVDKYGKADIPYSLSVNPYYSDVGFGSYNLIEVEIRNLADYYIAETLQLVKSPEVSVVDDVSKNLVLKPRESKSFFWKVRVVDGLDSDFSYTFPVAVFSVRNVSARTSFVSTFKDKVHSLDDVNDELERLVVDTRVFAPDLDLFCFPEKIVFVNQLNTINCTIRNSGNVVLDDLKVCLAQCQSFDLDISQSRNLQLSYRPTKTGIQEVDVSASNNDLKKSLTLDLDVQDVPKLQMTNLQYPKSLDEQVDYNVSFRISKLSYSVPQDVRILVEQNGFSDFLAIDNLGKDHDVILSLKGDSLKLGPNNVSLKITFSDLDGKDYVIGEDFQVNLLHISLWQRIRLFFLRFF